MQTIWSGHVVGTFFGYKRERSFDLSDGSRWTQEAPTEEPSCREFPTARLYRDRAGWTYLEVEGMASRVVVERA